MILKDEKLYYVGGVVRDELLGVASFDTDYCYEGDAIEFAHRLGLTILKENPAFGTVRVLMGEDEIDIASTREETYPQKGHLPQVERIACSLKEDLKRRDFTINAMAKRTTDGELVDYFSGKEDLENKLLRVLHDESFIDDPSRIIRGLKFSVRFGFELENHTKALQDEYLEDINYDLSWYRIKKELKETFSLNKQEAFDKFVEQGIYKLLGKSQNVPQIRGSIQDVVTKNPTNHSWLVYMGLFDLSNLELSRQEKRIVEWAERLKKEKPTNNTPLESLLINELRVG